jgi:vitamin-K-epoxide reductase (warfarin-sensitive)
MNDSQAAPSAPLAVRRGNRALFVVIAVLSLAGVIDSSLSLQRHYAKSATSFCDINEKFSCDIVNHSEWSEVMGIPVAAIGIAGYGLLFFLSAFRNRRSETPNRLLAAAIAGLCFALYLTYIEAYELTTWCILCLASLVLISLISLLATVIRLRRATA